MNIFLTHFRQTDRKIKIILLLQSNAKKFSNSFLEKKNVLLTGGCSFLGSEGLPWELLKFGTSVPPVPLNALFKENNWTTPNQGLHPNVAHIWAWVQNQAKDTNISGFPAMRGSISRERFANTHLPTHTPICLSELYHWIVVFGCIFGIFRFCLLENIWANVQKGTVFSPLPNPLPIRKLNQPLGEAQDLPFRPASSTMSTST